MHSALAKSQLLLTADIYRALEATARDALSISSMMGTSGQPGPISSSQSTLAPAAFTASDRQVRRKADSMCRSLTELCLALSEGKIEQAAPISKHNSTRPQSRDNELQQAADSASGQRPAPTADITRTKSSPRALSRLEQRRSSMLGTSALASPRFGPSEAGTPLQNSMAGRRTSLLLRNRRVGTEEPEEEDDLRFRVPSRANTEVGRVRNSPREYTSQQPLPDARSPSVQSSLPVRRNFTGSSEPNRPQVPSSGVRRFLDRSTPERDTTSVVGRLAEDRGQRKSSIGQGFALGRTGSLTRRTRPADPSTAAQAGGYQ